MKRFLILSVLFVFFNPSWGSLSYGANDVHETIPLPSGLSKDTQFIIFYMDKRFEAMQREMDKRFEQVDRRFEQIDKRFEQVDKRFDQVDKRFGDLITFLWILSGIFTAIMSTVIALIFWDRRTIVRQARREALDALEREGLLNNMLQALREFAKHNKAFEEALKAFKLL